MPKEIKDYGAAQEGEALPLPRYRALMELVYGDLIADAGAPELVGSLLCAKGDITELYWPLRKYEDRIALLKAAGAIEDVPIPKSIQKPKGE